MNMENFCGVPLVKDQYNGVHLNLKAFLEQAAQDQSKLDTLVNKFNEDIDGKMPGIRLCLS